MLLVFSVDYQLIVPVAAWCATIVALLVAYLRPPKGSVRALRARVNDLEELTERDHTRLALHLKRYRSLEGHVYRTEELDEETGAPDALNPSSQPGSGSLALIPDSDFPEAEFQAALARRKALPNG